MDTDSGERSRIRIAYLVRPAEGGIRAHLLTLLSELRGSRFEASVICPPGIPLFQDIERLGIHAVPLDLQGEVNPPKDLRAIRDLRRILRRLQPDILHMHSARAGLIGRLAVLGLKPRPRLVLTEHSFILDERTTGVKRKLVSWIMRGLSRSTDRIIAVSDALRQDLIREQGISPAKITTIHNGVVFADAPERAGEAMLVGTVSRLAPQKGVDHFLRAAALISGRFPQARYVVIGDGPYRGELESLAESVGIRDKVEFAGYREDAVSIIRTFGVFVLASLKETFGLTLVEAMSQRVPVVASRTGGIPEIVEDEVTGLLSEPGDPEQLAAQVCRLLEDRELARRLGEEGARSVRARFSSKVTAGKTKNVYLELMGRA